jgi:hypothetical protein
LGSDPDAPRKQTAAHPGSQFDAPPPVEVCGNGRKLALQPWTYCWQGDLEGICVDGAPPATPPNLGNSAEVIVSFPEPWNFEAEFKDAGSTPCTRTQRVSLERIGDGIYRLRPHGFAGKHDVTLIGRGDHKAQHQGDLFATFRWQTKADGPLPAPEAQVNILAGRNGTTESYGVNLSFMNLRTTPDVATARAVVTSANGRSLAIEFARDRPECIPEGSLRFTGLLEQGLAAAALGPPPFKYDVTVQIDGAEHRATAKWPDDVDEECSPCVPLRFHPALPALKHR